MNQCYESGKFIARQKYNDEGSAGENPFPANSPAAKGFENELHKIQLEQWGF